MTSEQRIARQILDQLQDAVSDKDLDRLADLFDDDVVLVRYRSRKYRP